MKLKNSLLSGLLIFCAHQSFASQGDGGSRLDASSSVGDSNLSQSVSSSVSSSSTGVDSGVESGHAATYNSSSTHSSTLKASRLSSGQSSQSTNSLPSASNVRKGIVAIAVLAFGCEFIKLLAKGDITLQEAFHPYYWLGNLKKTFNGLKADAKWAITKPFRRGVKNADPKNTQGINLTAVTVH